MHLSTFGKASVLLCRNTRTFDIFSVPPLYQHATGTRPQPACPFLQNPCEPATCGCLAKNAFCVSDSLEAQLANEMPGRLSNRSAALQSALTAQNLTIPLLFKHYSQATSKDGVSFSAFNVDPAFGDCVDAFVIADLIRLLPKKKRRYLGEAWQHRSVNGTSQEEPALSPEASNAATNR